MIAKFFTVVNTVNIAKVLIKVVNRNCQCLPVTETRKARETQPEHWPYLRGLGVARYRMGEWQEAITALTESSAAHVSTPEKVEQRRNVKTFASGIEDVDA